MKAKRGGADDARLIALVMIRPGQQGRFYRLPSCVDLKAVRDAVKELEKRKQAHNGVFALVPDEEISLNEIRRISVPIRQQNNLKLGGNTTGCCGGWVDYYWFLAY
jgi:hypothetical protein